MELSRQLSKIQEQKCGTTQKLQCDLENNVDHPSEGRIFLHKYKQKH